MIWMLSAITTVAVVRFEPSPPVPIEANDFFEVAVQSAANENPFSQFSLRGTLRNPQGFSLAVDGFCDSADGSRHKIRFLAPRAGSYSGSFSATASKRKGLLAVDAAYPFHFCGPALATTIFGTASQPSQPMRCWAGRPMPRVGMSP